MPNFFPITVAKVIHKLRKWCDFKCNARFPDKYGCFHAVLGCSKVQFPKADENGLQIMNARYRSFNRCRSEKNQSGFDSVAMKFFLALIFGLVNSPASTFAGPSKSDDKKKPVRVTVQVWVDNAAIKRYGGSLDKAQAKVHATWRKVERIFGNSGFEPGICLGLAGDAIYVNDTYQANMIDAW